MSVGPGGSRHRTRTDRFRPSWALIAFCLWLVLAPLPLGADRLWAQALVWPPLFLLSSVVNLGLTGRKASLASWLASPSGMPLLAILGMLGAQIWPGSPVSSALRWQTLSYGMTALACTAAGWLAVSLVRDERALRWMMGSVVMSGLLQSALAVGLIAWDQPVTLVDTELRADGVATGTFPNRNHLAFFLNLGLACGIGLLVGSLRRAPATRGRWLILADWLELLLSGKARLRMLLVLLVIALILTRSRGGNVAFFIGLIAAMGVYGLATRERHRGILMLTASLVAVDLLLIGTWVGVDTVVNRVKDTGLRQEASVSEQAALERALAPVRTTDDADGSSTAARSTMTRGSAPPGSDGARPPEMPSGTPSPGAPQEQSVGARVQPAAEAIDLVRSAPWFGSGGGTFYLAFMPWIQRDFGFYDHAHNDFLEIAADTGLLGLGALMLFALMSAWHAIRLIRTRRAPAVRGAAFAALMALTCITAHSLVDFSLQIPAIAVTSTVVLALPFAAVRVPRHGQRRETRMADERAWQDASRIGRASGWTLSVVCSAVLLTGAWHAWRLGVADYLAMSAENAVAVWESSGRAPTLNAIADALRALEAPIALVPGNADYRETRASLLFARARLPDRTDTDRRADLTAALGAYREAAERASISGYVWGNLMLVKYQLGEIDAEFADAFGRAVRLAPYEPGVQRMVVGVGFDLWPQLSAEQRRQVSDVVRRGWATNRRALLREAADAGDLEGICTDGSLPIRALCAVARQSASESPSGGTTTDALGRLR